MKIWCRCPDQFLSFWFGSSIFGFRSDENGRIATKLATPVEKEPRNDQLFSDD